MSDGLIPVTPGGCDKRSTALNPATRRKPTRRRRMIDEMTRRSERAATPETEAIDAAADVTTVEERLQRLQSELDSDAVMEAELRQVVESSLVVRQDLVDHCQILETQPSKVESRGVSKRVCIEGPPRRYPQRRRTSLMTTLQETAMKLRPAQRPQLDTSETTITSPAQEKRPNRSQNRRHEWPDPKRVTVESTVTKSRDDVTSRRVIPPERVSHSEALRPESWSERPLPQSASVKSVLKAFGRAEVQAALPSDYVPYLPPLSEGIVPEAIQPRAMQMHRAWQQQHRASDPAAIQVYVMPSGYIVQSVQLVLQKKQAEKPTHHLLSPFFPPEPYACKGTPFGRFLPIWQALCIEPFSFMKLDVPLDVTLLPPRTERCNPGCISGKVDVEGFLSRMDENAQGCHIMPDSTSEIPPVQLQRDVVERLMQFPESSPTASLELDRRLRDCAKRLERFYMDAP